MKAIIAITLLVLLFGCAAQAPKETTPETVSEPVEPVAEPKPVAKEPVAVKEEKKAPEVKTITLGAILPLTGDEAEIGERTKEAIDMAVEEINKEWAKDNMKLEMIYEDGQCLPKSAVTAASKLVNFDKVKAVVGGLCSGETLSAAPIFEKAKVVAVSPCSSNPNITDAGDYIFRVYPSDAFIGVATATYAFKELGLERTAILHSQSDWGVGMKDVFRDKFREFGGEVYPLEGVEDNATDVKAQLTKIKQVEPPLLYMSLYAGAGTLVLRQAKELGIESALVAGDALYDDQVLKNAGNAAEGLKVIIGYAKPPKEWEDKYKAKYGHDIAICVVNGYDATKILADAVKEVGYDSEKIKDYLYALKGYEGVSGVIEFDDNGDLKESKYAVMEVKNGKFVEIKVGSA